MARGETIIGESSGFKDVLPKVARRGPPKRPMEGRVKELEAENSALKNDVSELKSLVIRMQETMERLASSLPPSTGKGKGAHQVG